MHVAIPGRHSWFNLQEWGPGVVQCTTCLAVHGALVGSTYWVLDAVPGTCQAAGKYHLIYFATDQEQLFHLLSSAVLAESSHRRWVMSVHGCVPELGFGPKAIVWWLLLQGEVNSPKAKNGQSLNGSRWCAVGEQPAGQQKHWDLSKLFKNRKEKARYQGKDLVHL